MGSNPSRFQGHPNRPVEIVSWEDVQEFIKRLNRQEGWEVCRLPTEAQWEYAARAGTQAARYELDLDAIAWFGENSGTETHEVGQKQPNAWGLYDCWAMCGSGYRIGMPQITTSTVLPLTRKVLMLGPTVSTGVAVGATARSACGLPIATGATPAAASATLASVARVQALASDEWSKTCRRRRSGAESSDMAGAASRNFSIPRFNQDPLAS